MFSIFDQHGDADVIPEDIEHIRRLVEQ